MLSVFVLIIYLGYSLTCDTFAKYDATSLPSKFAEKIVSLHIVRGAYISIGNDSAYLPFPDEPSYKTPH